MAVGISTYCFTWRSRISQEPPLRLVDMVEQVRDLGASVLQICDYEPVEHLGAKQVQDLLRSAEANQVALELGTRGVDAHIMRLYLNLAQSLHAALVRTMYARFGDVVPVSAFERDLLAAGKEYADAKVELALETYEVVPTYKLAEIVARVANPWVGICLDPANCVAALETPMAVVATAAPFVNNVHVKDFAYEREAGGLGFHVTGRRLGDGQLDYRLMLEAVQSRRRDVSLVLEHWLPWQGSDRETCRVEAEWTEHGVRVLLDHGSARTNDDA